MGAVTALTLSRRATCTLTAQLAPCKGLGGANPNSPRRQAQPACFPASQLDHPCRRALSSSLCRWLAPVAAALRSADHLQVPWRRTLPSR